MSESQSEYFFSMLEHAIVPFARPNSLKWKPALRSHGLEALLAACFIYLWNKFFFSVFDCRLTPTVDFKVSMNRQILAITVFLVRCVRSSQKIVYYELYKTDYLRLSLSNVLRTFKTNQGESLQAKSISQFVVA